MQPGSRGTPNSNTEISPYKLQAQPPLNQTVNKHCDLVVRTYASKLLALAERGVNFTPNFARVCIPPRLSYSHAPPPPPFPVLQYIGTRQQYSQRGQFDTSRAAAKIKFHANSFGSFHKAARRHLANSPRLFFTLIHSPRPRSENSRHFKRGDLAR